MQGMCYYHSVTVGWNWLSLLVFMATMCMDNVLGERLLCENEVGNGSIDL